MRRRQMSPRGDWPNRLEQIGFTYHSMTGGYWREDAAYEFSEGEIDRLESATEALHQLCVEAAGRVIRDNRFAELRIPEDWRPLIIRSWERQDSSVYGRFDLRYDGVGDPKLLEYNADTPTGLLEASVAQWYWLREVSPDADQFNSLHERLIRRWSSLLRHASHDLLHLACLDQCEEDRQNLFYLADTAHQGGWRVQTLPVEQIGWDARGRQFVDQTAEPMESLFKLYPWEWMCQDRFAEHLAGSRMHVFEPAWKQLLSNKGILALLWEWYPDHPNLLPAAFSAPPGGQSYVRKPLWGREGGNVTIVDGGMVIETGGPYDVNTVVYQEYSPLPVFDGWHPVIGSWIIGEEASGIGIREDQGLVHGDLSRFVPHFFLNDVRDA